MAKDKTLNSTIQDLDKELVAIETEYKKIHKAIEQQFYYWAP